MRRSWLKNLSSLPYLLNRRAQFKYEVQFKLSTTINLHAIRDYLRKYLKYRYKRGVSRNIRARNLTTKFKQFIFGWNLLSDLNDGLLIVNIDENTFSRSVKSCYSWLPKGSSNGIVNDYSSGRIMIWTILSNGHWLCSLLQDIATLKEFWAYLLILKLFIQKWFSKAASGVTVILDNAFIHWTSEVKQSRSRHGMRIFRTASLLSGVCSCWACV